MLNQYLNRLSRLEEARILLRLFLERYPNSPFRALADDLRRNLEKER